VTRDEISVLLGSGRRMLGRAGISQATVARALLLDPSEVSRWLRRRDPPRKLTPRLWRFARFLAALRAAQAGQDAAKILAACDTRRYAPEAWHLDHAGRVRYGPPAGEGAVGAGRGRRGRLLLRDGVRVPGRPVDPAGYPGPGDGLAPGPHR
jgi:hypothetical protein